jgi:putative transcriptional regulator
MEHLPRPEFITLSGRYGQNVEMDGDFETLRGELLIASPALRDPNFVRTVVLVTEHTSDGAMGFVLNRPTPIAVSDALPNLGTIAGLDAVVYVGGPVQPESAMALAELEDVGNAAAIAFGAIGFLQPDFDPAELGDGVLRMRVFAGYSGWGAGQLEAELEEEAWILETAEPDDVFSPTPDDLWSSVLRRKGGSYAVVARMPVDPSVN